MLGKWSETKIKPQVEGEKKERKKWICTGIRTRGKKNI
jgi:hypothetical protein